jgi:DNA-binding transcriptional LysR family regulator
MINISLDQFRYFMKAAQLEHVGHAAGQLRVSPSSVSQAIAHMESELGFPLFLRQRQRIKLTPEGRMILAKIESILSGVDDLTRDSRKNGGISGSITIAATHGLVELNFTKLLINISKEHPNLHISVQSTTSSGALASILSGKSDMALCYNPQPHGELSINVLHSGQLVIAMAKNHPLKAKASSFSLDQLSNYHAALPPSLTGIDSCERHPMFSKFKIHPHTAINYDNYSLAASLVAQSDLWTLIPLQIAQKNSLWTPPLPKTWQAPFRICAVTRHQFRYTEILDGLKSSNTAGQ